MSINKRLDEKAEHHREGLEMKLTNKTTPQARNYQCDKCKRITNHKEMYDDNLCYDCENKND